MKATHLKWIYVWFVAAAVLIGPRPASAAEIAVAFSPGIGDLNAEELVIETIGTARQSIRLAAYAFTSKPIAHALLAAKRRGVDVQAVLDKSNLKERYGAAQFLANTGIPVRIDSEYTVMHDKFMVIDSHTVQTGSFSYTSASAKENAENAMVVRNHASFASEYDNEWRRLWKESRPLIVSR
jgi:phosphatidylserine/phosphatidylglycerophosphate/cardiolipin synthase-like enzyme